MSLHDKNGKVLEVGQEVNVHYKSWEGDYDHDCVYIVRRCNIFGDLYLEFDRLLWEDHGYNQYPFNCKLSTKNFLSSKYDVDSDSHKAYIWPNKAYNVSESDYFEIMGESK